MRSTFRRTEAIIASALMATMMACAPLAAFAQSVEPSAGAQSGGGTTEVTVQLVGGSSEAGGTSEPLVLPAPENTPESDLVDDQGNPDPNGGHILNPLYNPDTNTDGFGDNLAFSVPTAINFVASANGQLRGPSAQATYIENLSSFGVHTSSVRVEARSGWTVVDKDANDVTTSNAIDFQFGPATDVLDAYDYLQKREVGSISAWSMDAAGGQSDRVNLETSGHIHNVSRDIATQADGVATIHTYVTPTSAS